MKIMVCYDGSEAARKATKLASKYSKALNGHIIAVVALEGDTQKQLSDLEKAEQALETARVDLSTGKNSFETKLIPTKNMSAAENLIFYAEENQIDLIFIGIKKRSKVGKFFTGSTAQYVILHGSCPVISVQ